jgi:hypothetical protein
MGEIRMELGFRPVGSIELGNAWLEICIVAGVGVQIGLRQVPPNPQHHHLLHSYHEHYVPVYIYVQPPPHHLVLSTACLCANVSIKPHTPTQSPPFS